jgi:hypothetical protein
MAEKLLKSLVSYLDEPAGIDASQTSFLLVDTDLFPDVGDYRILVDQEYMLVTAHSVGVLTVTRGVEATVASAHSPNTQVFTVWTPGGMEAWFLSH